MRRESYWVASGGRTSFPTLAGEIEADVAIIGGGIVGVTAARLLKDKGLTVALVEARGVGEEVTGKSTAKVTSQHGVTYKTLKSKFGEEGARIYAQANEAGIRAIEELAARFAIACDLERVPAFTYTNDESRVSDIEEEVEVARGLRLPASLTRDTGLPYAVLAAMRWDNQAQFHPVKYVKGLARTIPGDGCHVFEHSRVVDYDPHRIATEAGSVRARHVLMATHMPLGQVGLFYARAYPHIHPVIVGRVEPHRAPPGMYINLENPHHSIRAHRDETGQHWLILGGTSFKPGHVDEERESFRELESFASARFGVSSDYRWTNEDYTPMDQAPFVGWSSTGDDAYLVATGFNAWGISNGTAAAMMIADLVEGREHPWLKLFDARRVKPIAGGKEFVKENLSVAAHLAGGYLAGKAKDTNALAPGEAALLKIHGDNVAAWRDPEGALHMVSAVCTHMGCLVGWNETDQTWDCPCHGSRFALDGSVIHGPAVRPLERKDQASRSA